MVKLVTCCIACISLGAKIPEPPTAKPTTATSQPAPQSSSADLGDDQSSDEEGETEQMEVTSLLNIFS